MPKHNQYNVDVSVMMVWSATLSALDRSSCRKESKCRSLAWLAAVSCPRLHQAFGVCGTNRATRAKQAKGKGGFGEPNCSDHGAA